MASRRARRVRRVRPRMPWRSRLRPARSSRCPHIPGRSREQSAERRSVRTPPHRGQTEEDLVQLQPAIITTATLSPGGHRGRPAHEPPAGHGHAARRRSGCILRIRRQARSRSGHTRIGEDSEDIFLERHGLDLSLASRRARTNGVIAREDPDHRRIEWASVQ